MKEYDNELSSYSNILSFPPTDPEKAAESIKIAKPKLRRDQRKKIARLERKVSSCSLLQPKHDIIVS